MADIKPMLEELKSKIPSKEQVIAFIEGMDIQIDTKKIKDKTAALQGQILEVADKTSKNPIVKAYVGTALSADITNKAILKLKEVLPNQPLVDKVDSLRMAMIKDLGYTNEEQDKKTSEEKSKPANHNAEDKYPREEDVLEDMVEK